MRKIEWSKKFEKSYKKCKKRGYNMKLLDDVLLIMGERDFTSQEMQQHKVHQLSGRNAGFWELHVTSPSDNWILKYKILGDVLQFDSTEVYLDSTGTHSDVLGNNPVHDLIWL